MSTTQQAELHKVVILCKSYDKDMLRAKRMAESIGRFNRDNIPLFISVPARDLEVFQREFGNTECTFLADEDILRASASENGILPSVYPPHLIQQLIKLEFWRLGLCRNYIWIDSDSYFIRDFFENDFFHDPDTPVIFQEEYEPLNELKKMQHVPKKIRNKRVKENSELITKFQNIFENSGPLLRFAGSMPIIWSVKVLKSFADGYLKKQAKNIYEILYEFPCETQLYGEYLHSEKVIPIHPRPFMFKSFLYADDFYLSQMKGENEYSISKEYSGICMQSNWALLKKNKATSERLKKHFQEFLCAIGLIRFQKGNKQD